MSDKTLEHALRKVAEALQRDLAAMTARAEQAEAEVARLRARLARLLMTWRERSAEPIPTDRAIGVDRCGDELEALLEEMR